MSLWPSLLRCHVSPPPMSAFCPYQEGEATKTDMAPGVPLTIQLAADEQFVNVVGADRAVLPTDDSENPWSVDLGKPGTPTRTSM